MKMQKLVRELQKMGFAPWGVSTNGKEVWSSEAAQVQIEVRPWYADDAGNINVSMFVVSDGNKWRECPISGYRSIRRQLRTTK